MLIAGRHPEVGKDYAENKDVIDAERILDQVAGEKVDRLVRTPPPPDKSVETERERDPKQTTPDCTAKTDAIMGAISEEIDGQRGENSKVKCNPKQDADRHAALGFHE